MAKPKKSKNKIISRIFWSLALLIAAAVSLLPPPGRATVLMYHFVGTAGDAAGSKNFVSRESSARRMAFLQLMRYRVIALDELYDLRAGKTKPQGREIAITFDDGNYTFETHALPVLKKYSFPVTQFIISGNVRNKLHGSMEQETIARLLAENPWFSVQGHTRTHPVLTELPPEKIHDELELSKQELEQMFGRPVRFLAYPGGIFNEQIAELTAKAGYEMAFTTSAKKILGNPDPNFAVTRVKITRSSDNLASFWFQISGAYDGFKEWRQRLKHAR